MKKLFCIIYDTVWFKVHPITGPVAPDDPMPTIYMGWCAAYRLAKWGNS